MDLTSGRLGRVAVCALVLAGLVAAGCGGDDDNGGTEDAAATTSEPPAAAPKTFCEQLTVETLAPLGATEVAPSDVEGTQSELPVYATCTMTVTTADTSGNLSYGISVPEANGDTLAQSRAAYDAHLGDYQPAQDITDVGEGGYGIDQFVIVLTGGRLMRVSSSDLDFATLTEAARAAAPQVADVEAPATDLAEPDCEVANDAAEAALGEAPTIRRDHMNEGGLSCTWATATASVNFGSRDGNPTEEFEMYTDPSMGAEPVDVGDGGYFVSLDGALLFGSGSRIATVMTSPVSQAAKEPLMQVAQAMAPTLG